MLPRLASDTPDPIAAPDSDARLPYVLIDPCSTSTGPELATDSDRVRPISRLKSSLIKQSGQTQNVLWMLPCRNFAKAF